MGKTVSHYKRRVQEIVGVWGSVEAWRAPQVDTVQYQVTCCICRLSAGTDYETVGWKTPKGEFHQVLHAWSLHALLIHPLTPPPQYDVEVTPRDREAAANYITHYAQAVMAVNARRRRKSLDSE